MLHFLKCSGLTLAVVGGLGSLVSIPIVFPHLTITGNGLQIISIAAIALLAGVVLFGLPVKEKKEEVQS